MEMTVSGEWLGKGKQFVLISELWPGNSVPGTPLPATQPHPSRQQGPGFDPRQQSRPLAASVPGRSVPSQVELAGTQSTLQNSVTANLISFEQLRVLKWQARVLSLHFVGVRDRGRGYWKRECPQKPYERRVKHIAELFLGKPFFSLQLKCRFKALAGLQQGMKSKSHKNRERLNSNEQSGVKCFDFSHIFTNAGTFRTDCIYPEGGPAAWGVRVCNSVLAVLVVIG